MSTTEISGKEFPVAVSFKITSETWSVKYDDTESQEYKYLTEKIVLEVRIKFPFVLLILLFGVLFMCICAIIH